MRRIRENQVGRLGKEIGKIKSWRLGKEIGKSSWYSIV